MWEAILAGAIGYVVSLIAMYPEELCSVPLPIHYISGATLLLALCGAQFLFHFLTWLTIVLSIPLPIASHISGTGDVETYLQATRCAWYAAPGRDFLSCMGSKDAHSFAHEEEILHEYACMERSYAKGEGLTDAYAGNLVYFSNCIARVEILYANTHVRDYCDHWRELKEALLLQYFPFTCEADISGADDVIAVIVIPPSNTSEHSFQIKH